jgi:MFS family permease
LWIFAAIREPPGAAVRESVTLRRQFQRAGKILRQDRIYRRYTMTRIAVILAGTALPFYSVYAKSILNAPEGMVGVYVTTRVAALLLSNLPWGWISDRRGNQLVMRLTNLGNGVTALMALALVGLVRLLPSTSQVVAGGWLPYMALPLFFIDGAMQPALMLIGNNFLLELVPEAERPLYLGFSSTLAGIAVLVSGLGGLVVDLVGFAGLFGLSLGLCVVGYVLAAGLPEPRETEG